MNLMNLFHRNSPLSWYEMGWPKELDPEQVRDWLQSISGNSASNGIRFITVASKDKIKHYIAFPSRHEKALLASLVCFLPDVEVFESTAIKLVANQVSKLRMTSKNRILNTSHPDIVSFAMLSALQTVESYECVILVWRLGKPHSPEAIPLDIISFHSSTWLGAIGEAFSGGMPTKLDTVAIKSMRNKHGQSSWDASLLIGVIARTKSRRLQLLNRIVGAIKIAEAPGVRLGSKRSYRKRLLASYKPLIWPLFVNVDELLGLLSWPLGNRLVGGLARISSRQLPAPVENTNKGRVIAKSARKDNDSNLLLSASDNLMHLHVLGPTGVGKSTLMLNLITQDIHNGHGVVVVDPKGDLVTDILCRIPDHRKQDIVVLDPSDMMYPVGLNPLENTHKDAALIADNILAIFRKLYGSYFGPRTQDILHAGILTLLRNFEPNLCALPLLYTNADFRSNLIRNLHDPLGLGSFWQWYETLSASERNAAIAPVMNKLRQFFLRPNMRYVLGQSSPKFSLGDVFTKNKVLLVSLGKGSMGSEASQLFGSLVVSKIWQEAQRRVKVPTEKRSPVFLYIDEVQDYLHLPMDINDVLTQARSYGLGMILAHQHLGQLPKDLKTGVLSNARSKICFQLTHEDAGVMSETSSILTPEDFENLPKHHIYAKLVKNGHVANWVSGVTLPPNEATSNPEDIRKLSREQYGRLASEVDAALGTKIAFTIHSPTSDISGNPVIGRRKLSNMIFNSRTGYTNRQGGPS